MAEPSDISQRTFSLSHPFQCVIPLPIKSACTHTHTLLHSCTYTHPPTHTHIVSVLQYTPEPKKDLLIWSSIKQRVSYFSLFVYPSKDLKTDIKYQSFQGPRAVLLNFHHKPFPCLLSNCFCDCCLDLLQVSRNRFETRRWKLDIIP